MTTQVTDSFEYNGRSYSIAGISGGKLFEPTAHGMNPRWITSACGRGYVVNYRTHNQRLELHDLTIFCEETPKLFGVKPLLCCAYCNSLGGLHECKKKQEHASASQQMRFYQNVGGLIPLTGGVLIGSEFINESNSHIGFFPASRFQTVRELLFRDGILIEDFDRSADIEKMRERRLQRSHAQPAAAIRHAEIKEWAAQCFSLDYFE